MLTPEINTAPSLSSNLMAWGNMGLSDMQYGDKEIATWAFIKFDMEHGEKKCQRYATWACLEIEMWL